MVSMLPDLSGCFVEMKRSGGGGGAAERLNTQEELQLDLYQFLCKNNVPKDENCCALENQRCTTKVEGGKKNPKSCCGVDGFLMSVQSDTLDNKLGSETHVTRDPGGGIEPEWGQFDKNMTLQAKLVQLSEIPEKQLVWKDNRLCTYESLTTTGQWVEDTIDFNIYKNGNLRNMDDIEEEDKYLSELLLHCSHFFLDNGLLAFVCIVNNIEVAQSLRLPYKNEEVQKPYLYLNLLCSSKLGGGKKMMSKLLTLCRELRVGQIMLAALGHVIWYYYNVYGARFINRNGDIVGIDEQFKNLIPLSECELQEIAKRRAKRARLAKSLT